MLTGHQQQPGRGVRFDHVGRGAPGVPGALDALDGPKRRHADLDRPAGRLGREFFEAEADRRCSDRSRHRIDRHHCAAYIGGPVSSIPLGTQDSVIVAGLLGGCSAYVQRVLSVADRHPTLAWHGLAQGVALDRARHAPRPAATATQLAARDRNDLDTLTA